ncbi:MAG: hypothetical protein K2I10_13720 [Lachnospiraceae bacterium]|nr:hypothetical protein [Lachnospiraceae bacterium]
MKKYVLFLPGLLFPYFLIFSIMLSEIGIGLKILIVITVMLFISALLCVLYVMRAVLKNQWDAGETGRIVFVLKCCQFPLGICMTFFEAVIVWVIIKMNWGVERDITTAETVMLYCFSVLLALFYFVVLNLACTIFLGMPALACVIWAKRNGLLTKKEMVCYGVGSFVNCIDVFFVRALLKKLKAVFDVTKDILNANSDA